jgi:hypothetical protein
MLQLSQSKLRLAGIIVFIAFLLTWALPAFFALVCHAWSTEDVKSYFHCVTTERNPAQPAATLNPPAAADHLDGTTSPHFTGFYTDPTPAASFASLTLLGWFAFVISCHPAEQNHKRLLPIIITFALLYLLRLPHLVNLFAAPDHLSYQEISDVTFFTIYPEGVFFDELFHAVLFLLLSAVWVNWWHVFYQPENPSSDSRTLFAKDPATVSERFIIWQVLKIRWHSLNQSKSLSDPFSMAFSLALTR